MRDGLSTKIHMAVRGLGCPVRVVLTAGHRGDASQAEALIEELATEIVMADAAYDSDMIRRTIKNKGAETFIPGKPSRAFKHPLDSQFYAASPD